jgi:hypothetical protein
MALLDNENVALNYKGILNFGATINENINTTPKQITDGDNIGSNIWIDTLHTFLGVAITTPVASALAVRGNALENIASFRDDADSEVAFITSPGVLASTGLLITPAGEVAFSTAGKISAATPELEVPDLIQIGGTSNASPALKKNSADLQVRLADDSQFAKVTALNYKVQSDANPFAFLQLELASNSAIINFANDNGDQCVLSFNISKKLTINRGLYVNTTEDGFLPPRMTAAQGEAITSPTEGLMIYSTDGSGAIINTSGWWGYDGTTWVKIN